MFDILCDSSARWTIHMKSQTLFLRKNITSRRYTLTVMPYFPETEMLTFLYGQIEQTLN